MSPEDSFGITAFLVTAAMFWKTSRTLSLILVAIPVVSVVVSKL